MINHGASYKTPKFHTAAVAIAVGNEAKVCDGLSSFATLAIQIKGITVATVTFQGTVDGTNWEDVKATDLKTGTAATTATADGQFRADVRGLLKFRANLTAWTSGATTVTGILTAC